MHQVGGGRVRLVGAQALGAGDAEDVENPLLDLVEDEEEPDAEGEVETGEVEEADIGEDDPHRQVHGAPEHREADAQVRVGQEGEVEVEPLHAQVQEGKGEPHPHDRVAEQGSHLRHAPLFAGEHPLRQLHHRVGEALVGRPLAVQDAAEADQHEPHRHHQPEPPGHRLDPRLPRDRSAPGQALVVPLDGLEVLGHDPLRDVVVEQLFEAVFGGGVVERVDDGPDQEEHQPPGRHRDRHQQHAVDENEVGFGQRQPATEKGDDDVGEDGTGEEEQGPGRGGVEADPVVLEDGDVRGDDPDRQAQESADTESLQTEGGFAHVVDFRR